VAGQGKYGRGIFFYKKTHMERGAFFKIKITNIFLQCCLKPAGTKGPNFELWHQNGPLLHRMLAVSGTTS
jgi:hypothetical protein